VPPSSSPQMLENAFGGRVKASLHFRFLKMGGCWRGVVRHSQQFTIQGASMSFQLPSDTHIGTVSLTVSDLDRSARFYSQALGMRLFDPSGGVARLGAGEQIWLELVEKPGARKPRGTTGMYHFAILFPSRVEL